MLGGSSECFNQQIAAIARQFKLKTILELGCGKGKLASLIADQAVQITAVQKLFAQDDERHLHNLGYCRVFDSDILEYFKVGFDDFYDAVVALDVIEHFLLSDAISILSFALYRASYVILVWPSRHPQSGAVHSFDRHRCSLELNDLASRFDVVFYTQTGFAEMHFQHRYHFVVLRGYMNALTAPVIQMD